jgi:hypothetical protein
MFAVPMGSGIWYLERYVAATHTKTRETPKTAKGNQTGNRRQNGCFSSAARSGCSSR